MTPFSSIHIEGFRRFEAYRLVDLSRVNLLVGDNGCGKSSILEAILLLATGGAPWAFANLAWSRGEIVDDAPPRRPSKIQPQPVISHFFRDHRFVENSCFTIDDEAVGRSVKAELQRVDDEPEAYTNVAVTCCSPANPTEIRHSFPVFDEGALRGRLRRSTQSIEGAFPNVEFLAASPGFAQSLGEVWDEVLKHRREDDVARALRLLEPKIENVVFLTSQSALRIGGSVGVFVALEGQSQRVPLASMGEGLYRLLEIVVRLLQSSQGVLCVDEIDTGLHYSVLGDIWKLIVTAARRWNVQVFATTHSFDCLRGLAWLCENYPDLAQDVCLQKIDPRLEESVPLRSDKISIALEQHIEVR